MKSLKSIFSFIVPLTAMLITFAIFLFTTKVVDDYKLKISNDYSIVVVSSLPLVKDNLSEFAGIKVKNIVTLEKNKIISNMKNNLSDKSIKLLKQRLPYFYKIHLEKYPTSSELNQIKLELKEIKTVKKVEIFSKNHNQIYLLLLIIQKIIAIVFVVILLYAVIIIAKQIKIWFYEHHEKIAIMRFHGASILYSAGTVIRHAIFGALISFVIVAFLMILLNENLSIIFPSELQNVVDIRLSINAELIKVFILSLFISISTIFGVLFKYKLNND